MPEWKDIATAPKDEPILAYSENIGWEYFVVKWIEDRFHTLDSDYNPFFLDPPTHWQPLPTPPIPTGKENGG